MMLNIGLMRQAVNVNGKAGLDFSDRLSALFPSICLEFTGGFYEASRRVAPAGQA
jgi:hypothetical protein